MCWEERFNEGIILYDISYTPPGGPQRLVLAQANLAQIHVPYDDNGARLHDLSDFGLGGWHLDDLAQNECPEGDLLQNGGKNILCLTVKPRGHAYKYYGDQLQGYVLTLFSISRVGLYNYIVRWDFYDNGAIEPVVGAAGKLQRYSGDPAYGWPLDDANSIYGVSHTHNYYWRLDFDLEDEQHDVVEEIAFNPGADQASFGLGLAEFSVETARQVSAAAFRSWRVKDMAITNEAGHVISYQLEPDPVHIFRGPAYEPWTQAEFYATRYNVCEKWASHNPSLGGCADNLSAFVNGENLAGADLVVWYGHSFHHLPRAEDEAYMHTHWSSFLIQPRDWAAANPLVGIIPEPPPVPPGSFLDTYLPTVLK
jgi:primary-amine oxidase